MVFLVRYGTIPATLGYAIWSAVTDSSGWFHIAGDSDDKPSGKIKRILLGILQAFLAVLGGFGAGTLLFGMVRVVLREGDEIDPEEWKRLAGYIGMGVGMLGWLVGGKVGLGILSGVCFSFLGWCTGLSILVWGMCLFTDDLERFSFTFHRSQDQLRTYMKGIMLGSMSASALLGFILPFLQDDPVEPKTTSAESAGMVPPPGPGSSEPPSLS